MVAWSIVHRTRSPTRALALTNDAGPIVRSIVARPITLSPGNASPRKTAFSARAKSGDWSVLPAFAHAHRRAAVCPRNSVISVLGHGPSVRPHWA